MWNLSIMDPAKCHIGILGDGQLARMMMLEAHKMGISSTALTYSPSLPCCPSRQLLYPIFLHVFKH